jgi:succinate-acetate transporter protein
LRKNIGLIALFGFLTITFLMLAIGAFSGNASCHKAGGALGTFPIFTAFSMPAHYPTLKNPSPNLDLTDFSISIGIVTALIAFYCALSGLMTKDGAVFVMPLGELGGH